MRAASWQSTASVLAVLYASPRLSPVRASLPPRGTRDATQRRTPAAAPPPALLSTLADAMNVDELNPLQKASFPLAASGVDYVVHAETGSGKTLTFALPLVASLGDVPTSGSDGLHALLLSPTLELCAQTARVLNQLSPGCAAVLETADAPVAAGVRVLCAPAALALARLQATAKAPRAGGRRVDGTTRAPPGARNGSDAEADARTRIAALEARLDAKVERERKKRAGGGAGDRSSVDVARGEEMEISAPTVRPDLGAPFDSLRVLVLDEADALIAPLGKYATAKQKEVRAKNQRPATAVVEWLCSKLGDRLQLIAASATVGRPLRRELERTSSRKLKVVQVASREPYQPKGGEGSDGASAAAAAEGSRLVKLPATLRLEVLVTEETNFASAIAEAMSDEEPTASLIFTAENRPLAPELRLLQQCGLPQAVSLRDHLVSAAGGVAGEEGQPVLVASPSIARGLDLPDLDLVIILGLPATADKLLHLAGRTARNGAAGRAIVIADPVDAKARLPALSAQLARELPSRSVEGFNEEWAKTWEVHQKVVQAASKGY